MPFSHAQPVDRRHARRLATRAAILEAAERIVLDDGYTSLVTKRLVEEAGVSERTIFNHFDSLEDVVLSRVGDLLTETFEGHALPAGLAPQELPHAIDRFFRTHIESDAGANSLQRFARLAIALGSVIGNEEEAIGSAVFKTLGKLAQALIYQVEELYPELQLDFRLKLNHYIFNLSTAIPLGMGKSIVERFGTNPQCVSAAEISGLSPDEALTDLRAGILWAFDQVNHGQPTF